MTSEPKKTRIKWISPEMAELISLVRLKNAASNNPINKTRNGVPYRKKKGN